MLDSNTQLKVLFHNGATFTDYSQDAQDFTRDSFVVDFQTTSTWYVGFNKPIDAVYFDFITPNNVSNLLTVQYYNGSAFVDTAGQLDSTKGFTRGGFLQWDRDQTDQVETIIDGKTFFWYKINTDTNHLATADYNGMGIIFSDDSELATKVPSINDTTHLQGQLSHILMHINARNWIVQSLRNDAYGKRDSDGKLQDITAWDLLRIDQVKEAATYKALEFIFFNYSDEPGDKFEMKSKSYASKYKQAFGLARLALDTDDDGVEDTSERERQTLSSRVSR